MTGPEPGARVALVTQFFPPETFAGANRVAAMADALARLGPLTVVAPPPRYPDPSTYLGYVDGESSPNVVLKRVRLPAPRRRSWIGRARAELQMSRALAVTAGRCAPAVLVASSPSMFLGPASLLVARRRGARFLWDLRDLTWEYAQDSDVVASAVARAALRVVGRIMWASADAADVIVCANDGLGAVVAEHLPRRRVEVIRNGVDDLLLAALDPTPPSPCERIRLLYAGLVGHAQGLEVLLEVARRLPQLDVVVAGDGPLRAELEAQATASGIANVTFTGYLTRDELVRRYHDSDVLFGQLRKSDLHARTAVPSKLFEYMAAGRPIVYAGEGAAADLIGSVGCGFVVEPGDAAGIAETVRRLTPEDRLRVGRRGRTYVEALPSRADEMERFAAVAESLIPSGGSPARGRMRFVSRVR